MIEALRTAHVHVFVTLRHALTPNCHARTISSPQNVTERISKEPWFQIVAFDCCKNCDTIWRKICWIEA